MMRGNPNVADLHWTKSLRSRHSTLSAAVLASDRTSRTVLMYAAYGGRIQVAQTLLAKGAEINAKDNGGLFALGYAETTHHDEVGQILKKAGAK